MNSGKFEVYRTSAGAGKTYTIVREFIKFNLQGKSSFDSVAAVTFTNKAANEMKDRILEYLFAISENHTHRKEIASLIDELSTETGLSTETIISGCAKLLHDILHNYSRFSVVTIDSFIHDILRIFSHDLKLPENFNVEIETDMLTDMIVSELLAGLESETEHFEQKKLTDYIIDLALNRFEEKDNWDITSELISFAEMLFTEEGMNNIPAMAKYEVADFSDFAQQLLIVINQIIAEIKVYGEAALKVIHESGLTVNDFYYKGTGIYNYFFKASNATSETELKINSYVQKTIDNDKWSSSKEDISADIKQKLFKYFQKIYNHPLVHWLPMLSKLRSYTGPMALLVKMQQILNQYKIQNQIIPISEFNMHIAEVVRNEPAPFIYERLGQKFRHFLIDEFQDTSVMQWQNFLPLIENSLSQNNNTLIVGDVKQAIYRFRNGEMEQLMYLPDIYDKPEHSLHFDDIEASMNYSFSDRALSSKNTNYRSGQHIVELNNLHFQWIWEKFTATGENKYISQAYENSFQQFPPQAKDLGMVAFYQPDAEDYRTNTLDCILNIVNTYERKGDIAILTRGNASAKQIAMFLMQQNPRIPVISSESLELGFSPAVNCIIDLLKFIYQPSDNIAIIGIYSYLFLYSDRLKKLFPEYSNWLNDVFLPAHVNQRHEVFLQLLHSAGYKLNLQQISALHPTEIVTCLIDEFKLAGIPDSYVMFFQNKLSDFLRQNNEGLAEVLIWWEDKGKKTSIIIPEGTDAVRILTIHKAKGLQFPVVIYPFADFKLKDTNKYIWVNRDLFPASLRKHFTSFNPEKFLIKLSIHSKLPDSELKEFLNKEILKQQLDTLNIHYVAMTRAKYALHVISKPLKEGKSKNGFSSVNELISGFIIENQDILVQHENNGNISLRYGNDIIPPAKQSEEKQPELSRYFLRPANSLKIRTASYSQNKAGQTGELFHLFMSETHDLTNINEKFADFCIKQTLSEEQIVLLTKLLQTFKEDFRIGEYFSEGMNHLNETTIIDKTKTYRPDKIVYNDSKTFVIDFKTGKKSPKHREQIDNYTRLLEDIGFVNITSVLVYIRENEIEIIGE